MSWRPLLVGVMSAVAALAHATDWQFSPPIAATAQQGARIFHHLESAGREGIAVAGATVALVWEDNHDGTPRAYVAFKSSAGAFSPSHRISGINAAYEPTVIALSHDRFVFAWEEAGAVWARTGDAKGFDAPVQLARDAAQVSLAAADGDVYAVWSQQHGRYSGVHYAHVALADGRLMQSPVGHAVDRTPLTGDQSYPAVTLAADRLPVVAWEDRRFGHTAIVATHADRALSFAAPVQINETRRQGIPFGNGTGAMRVTLARAGDRIVVLWMDKRNFTAGYDVYAAISDDNGAHFGKNEKVEDDFGDAYGQWHGLVVATGTRVVALWDDDRDGSADVWMSERGADGWGDNVAVPGASGPGEQGSPVAAFDAEGNLHLAWVAKSSESAPDRINYLLIRPAAH